MSGSSGSEHVVSRLPAHDPSTARFPDLGMGSVDAGKAAHVLPVIDADATPRADVVPGQIAFQLPAHLGFVGHIGSALEATLALIGRDPATGSDLETAVLTAAKAIIAQARPWAPLEVSIAIDDTDAFVRLRAELLDPDEPAQFREHVRATLRRNVESHEVLHEGRSALAVLHVPLEPAEPM